MSVVIAAHDEETVIGGTLDRLLAGARPGELEVVVAANGCTDRTVEVASSRAGVRVVQTPTPSKVAALDAADEVATGFPRVYLDADIAVPVDAVRALAGALASAGAAVAVPGRHVVLTGRPLAVRCYYAVQDRLPAIRDGLFGRGMIAVSQAGRSRFATFPDVQADDLFLDALFGPDERVHVRSVRTRVEAPRTTADLLRRLERVRRGNRVLRARGSGNGSGSGSGHGSGVRGSSSTAWLGVVARRPWLAPAAVVYVALTLLADRRARRSVASTSWGRDESTRQPAAR